MDNRKYEALINIAETGSITQAAERMGYTQSGITQMVNSLERELGVKLLQRTNKGAHLTQNGLILLPYMREEHRWERSIRQECDRMSGKETGTVNVGCLSSISTAWMPKILETFAKQFPQIKIHMLEHEAPDLERMLLNGRIDMGLMELSDKAKYLSRTLFWDEVFAVVPQGHPLSKKDKVTLKEVAQYPFISYATGTTEGSDELWPDLITGHKEKFNVMYTCKSDMTAIQMVMHHLGVSIAGNLMLENNQADTVRISLDPPIYRPLGIAQRAGEDPLPATKSFIKCVIDTIGENPQSQR